MVLNSWGGGGGGHLEAPSRVSGLVAIINLLNEIDLL